MCSPVYFFFQAEDGIRDGHVTGVQTCALPICVYLHLDHAQHGLGSSSCGPANPARYRITPEPTTFAVVFTAEIGRASCRERVGSPTGPASLIRTNSVTSTKARQNGLARRGAQR